MNIEYKCRHCGTRVGSINSQYFHTSELGFDQLSVDERQEMIEHKCNGDITVKTICEDCQEALERHPEFYEWDTFIQ